MPKGNDRLLDAVLPDITNSIELNRLDDNIYVDDILGACPK